MDDFQLLLIQLSSHWVTGAQTKLLPLLVSKHKKEHPYIFLKIEFTFQLLFAPQKSQ